MVLPYINMNLRQVYTCSPSWTLLPPPSRTIPLGRPSAPGPSIQYRASNLDWQLISYMILYMFQCHSPKSSHPLPLQKSHQTTGSFWQVSFTDFKFNSTVATEHRLPSFFFFFVCHLYLCFPAQKSILSGSFLKYFCTHFYSLLLCFTKQQEENKWLLATLLANLAQSSLDTCCFPHNCRWQSR